MTVTKKGDTNGSKMLNLIHDKSMEISSFAYQMDQIHKGLLMPHWQDQGGIGRDFPATVVVMQIGQLYSRRLVNIQLKGE